MVRFEEPFGVQSEQHETPRGASIGILSALAFTSLLRYVFLDVIDLSHSTALIRNNT